MGSVGYPLGPVRPLVVQLVQRLVQLEGHQHRAVAAAAAGSSASILPASQVARRGRPAGCAASQASASGLRGWASSRRPIARTGRSGPRSGTTAASPVTSLSGDVGASRSASGRAGSPSKSSTYQPGVGPHDLAQVVVAVDPDGRSRDRRPLAAGPAAAPPCAAGPPDHGSAAAVSRGQRCRRRAPSTRRGVAPGRRRTPRPGPGASRRSSARAGRPPRRSRRPPRPGSVDVAEL